jgi:hypothetical protein
MALPISDIDKILYSIVDELEHFTRNLGSDAKVTPLDVQMFIESIERRDHALNNRLNAVSTHTETYQMPESLKTRLVQQFRQLEQDRNLRLRVEQIMARHASVVWGALKKIKDSVVRSERYKIKVDKTETGPSTRH